MTHEREIDDAELIELAKICETQFSLLNDSNVNFKLYNTGKAVVFFFENSEAVTITAHFELQMENLMI